MAEKKTGISPDLLIHPGETISDLLEERGIRQKELALRAGVSEAFLSDVIRGKKDISKGLAMGLEYALDVPASFWLNLQANYDAEVLSSMEEHSVASTELEAFTALDEVIEYLNEREELRTDHLTKAQTILRLRRYFHVSSLESLRAFVPEGYFRRPDAGPADPYVLGAWLCICRTMSTRIETDAGFQPAKIDELTDRIKKLMYSRMPNKHDSLKILLAEYGIDFGIAPCFRSAPVQGYIVRKKGSVYQLILTLYDTLSDSFWFSLFHELGHLVNGDVSTTGGFIDPGNLHSDPDITSNIRENNAPSALHKEQLADAFAINALGSREVTAL